MGLSSSKNKGADSSTALSSKSIKKAIRNKQLAPILEGRDDDPVGTLDECPICLLHYPAINTAACCGSSLCTDCYIQVAISRSEHDAGSCPFCNKANYSVIFRPKNAAQRAAERREREHVEQAVLHARQEEERRAEQRRLKHAASASTPMSPEQGSLAEEWSRAQEEEERYLSSRQDRWREALARAAVAAEAGDEADDMDVEELMIMQALLLSLDEQHSGAGGAEGASGSSRDAGPSSSISNTAAAQASRDGGHLPPRHDGSGTQAPQDAGHLSAGSAAASPRVAAATSSAPPLADAATMPQDRGSRSQTADVPDAELLAHAARLAERAVALQPRQLDSTRSQGGLVRGNAASAEASAGPATAASCDTTIAYVETIPAAESRVTSGVRQREEHSLSSFGSAALADALATATGWASSTPAAPHSRLLSSNSNGGSGAPAGIGSSALAQALAAANGWGAASEPEPAGEHAAQVAAAQQPPFLGMVMMQAAAHIQAPTDLLSVQPARNHQGTAGAVDLAATNTPQACAAGTVDTAKESGPADSCSTESLDEAGGAALLLQPDGTSLLVLLINASTAGAAAAAPAKAAAATLPAQPAQGTPSTASLAGPGVPLYEINCEDAADRHLAAALAAADVTLMQHSQAALRQQTLAMQTADEQYRVALDAYAARDAAMQQALKESDERLKAMYRSL